MPEQVALFQRGRYDGPRLTQGHQLTGDVAELGMSLDTTEHLDPAVTVRCGLQISHDGGQTWHFAGGFTRKGGARLDKNGNPSTRSGAVFFARDRDGQPKALGKDPLVRATMFVMDGALTTQATLTARTLEEVKPTEPQSDSKV